MEQLSENSLINIKNKSHSVRAAITVPAKGGEGVIPAPLPPAVGRSISDSLRCPAFQGMPWKVGQLETWGIFSRRF
jgi:hypothetical protein